MMVFRIPGIPIPQARHRTFMRGGYVSTWNPQKSNKEALKCLLKQTMDNMEWEIQEGPLIVDLEYLMPIPESMSKKKKAELIDTPHVKKPDLDNLIKFTLDLFQGIAFKDDSQIYELTAGKYYHHEPKTIITIKSFQVSPCPCSDATPHQGM